MISHHHKFIMVHVPKTAGTSIEKIFGVQYYNDDEKPKPIGFEFEQEKSNQKLTFSHPKHFRFMDYEKFLSDQIMLRYFKFSFVRNPWDLMVSKYEYGRSTNIVSWGFCDKIGKTKQEVTFEEYMEHTKDYNDMTYEYWLNANKYKLDYVGKLENINEDWAYICGRCQMEKLELPLVNKNKKRKLKYQEYYNDEMKDFVYNKYKVWVDTFKYEF
jgi:Sulfotransferase family